MVQIAGLRAKQLREVSGFANAGVYDPQSIGGTHVIYVLHDIKAPERYGLPATPVIPPSYTYWKWLAKPIGLWMGLLGIVAVFFHRVFVGPKLPQPESPPTAAGRRPDTVEASAGRRHELLSNDLTNVRDAKQIVSVKHIVHRGELLRHPVYTRVIHWSVAIFFVLSLTFRLRDLFTVAISLADTAVWRRTPNAIAASVVWPALRHIFLFPVS